MRASTTTLIIILATIVLSVVLYYMYMRIYNTRKYTVKEFPNFLSKEECDVIKRIAEPHLVDSLVYNKDSDDLDNKTRVSKQHWIKDSDDDTVKNITTRISTLTNTLLNYKEDMQVVKYTRGGFFTPHYDSCAGTPEYCKRLTQNGQRLLTFLIYLNDDFTGGETIFPKINKTIKPELGKAVLFYNVDDNDVGIDESFHGGQPVLSGEKWIANIWIHSS